MRGLFLIPLAASLASAGAAPLVSPSGDAIAANLLRIEVQLDAPLAAPLDMRQVRLIDASGAAISDALLDLPLASHDGKRVSILLHPGRIKTGVGPNVALGPALHAGDTVTLLIDDPQLPRPIKKSWRVSAAVSGNIDLHQWQINAPAASTRQPLLLAFPAALDAGAVALIAVAAQDGSRLRGKAILRQGETQWQFTPATPWRAGQYQVRVHPDLEDPQGNRMCSAFEQFQQSGQGCRDDGALDFTVR